MINPEDVLTDVIVLSEKQCVMPIQGELAYAVKENFVGRVIDGYDAKAINVCLLAKKAANALCQVQKVLNKQQLGLFIFDGFRPHRAVRDFHHWFNQPPVNDYELARKAIHYPSIEKTRLDARGYVAGEVSRHNFGHAVDLSLIDLPSSERLDMGACFDFFDGISHTTATVNDIGEVAFSNRSILYEVMQQCGFLLYEYEYWHFDYHERETDEPMDMIILPEHKGLNV